ncbi:hypothetical protein PGO55_25270, partial [Klebsiella aerogenes]
TGGTADRNRSHWSTSKTPSYTKSVSWQHHPFNMIARMYSPYGKISAGIVGFTATFDVTYK